MKRFALLSVVLLVSLGVRASWYWPFGSDDGMSDDEPRISELIEPASVLIDEAADLAADGKVDESVEKYRAALTELDRIERENPERAKGTEFATVRNKRAYVNAAIDAMLLSQVKSNAKAVSVSDTSALEKRFAEEHGEKAAKEKSAAKENPVAKEKKSAKPKKVQKKAKKAEKKAVEPAQPKAPPTRREQAMQAIEEGDYATAEILVKGMLAEKPNGAAALNLKALMEMKQGKLKDAERTLDQAIMSNPRNHFAYYNMVKLLLQIDPESKAAAKRYYETGRLYGGPEDERLEALLK